MAPDNIFDFLNKKVERIETSARHLQRNTNPWVHPIPTLSSSAIDQAQPLLGEYGTRLKHQDKRKKKEKRNVDEKKNQKT